MRYDGQDLSHLFKVESVERSILPSVEVSTKSVGGRDGSVFGSTTLSALELAVNVRMIAPRVTGLEERRMAFEKLRRLTAAALYRDHLCELVLDDAPDVYYMAVLTDDTDIERFAETGGATLTFLCPDPIAHGRLVRKSAKGGGRTGARVGGTAKTAPVVYVQCNGQPATVLFDGETFRTTQSVSGELAIDAVSHICDSNGSTVPVNIEDDYPTWEPGLHYVECPLPYEVVWEERWL